SRSSRHSRRQPPNEVCRPEHQNKELRPGRAASLRSAMTRATRSGESFFSCVVGAQKLPQELGLGRRGDAIAAKVSMHVSGLIEQFRAGARSAISAGAIIAAAEAVAAIQVVAGGSKPGRRTR